MPNGDGWYWEVVSAKDVIARGVAENQQAACKEAHHAAMERGLVE